jgi:hypothetical protein
MIHKLIAAAVATTSILVIAGTANAAPIITEWSFETDAAFTAFTPSGPPPNGVEGLNNNATLNAPTLLRWGDPNTNQFSSLQIGGTNGHIQSPPDIFTGINAPGTQVQTFTLTHNNQSIPDTAATLRTATLTSLFTITPVAPSAGAPVGPLELQFDIQFKETPNIAGTCAADGATVCPDIFVVTSVNGFNPANFSFNDNFFVDGNPYNIQLFLSGLGVLTNAECQAAFGDTSHNGCIGLITEENQANPFQAFTAITTQQFNPTPVPEPSSLALFGFGLAWLGFMRLKRN